MGNMPVNRKILQINQSAKPLSKPTYTLRFQSTHFHSQENYTSLLPTHTGVHVVTVLMKKKRKSSHLYELLHFTFRLILSDEF